MYTRVCVHQPPTSAFGEEQNRQRGAVEQTPGLLEAAGRGELPQPPSPLEDRVLLGLWKLSLILKQLGGKAPGPGATQRERLARMGLHSLDRESSAGP